MRARTDILSIADSRHSLEDVYLELVGEDVEAGAASSWTRIRAIFRKELREYQRNRSIVLTMAVIPLVFVLGPLINIFALPSDAAGALRFEHILVYMLGIPAIVPAVIASYSVVGERLQGSLEPVLTTPIPRDEFLLAKALAALVPSLLISYVVFIGVVVAIELFAQPGIASR